MDLLNNTPSLLLSTVMEFAFQVRSKLLTFSLRRLSTSSFILNFSECNIFRQVKMSKGKYDALMGT